MKESDLIPKDRASRLLRIIGVTLTVVVAGSAFVAIFVPLPEKLTCSFELVPESGSDPVKAPISGTVERVEVTDGSDVKAGDALFAIRSEELGVLAERAKKLGDEIAASRPVDEAQIAQRRSALEASKVRVKSLGSELAYVKKRRGVALTLLKMAHSSRDKALISELELLNARQAAADAGRDEERLARELEAARAEIAGLIAGQKSEEAERILSQTRLEGELLETKAALAGSERSVRPEAKNLFVVLAPYDGVIAGMGPRRAGAVIERGEILCQLAKGGARLRAELRVPELDAGKLERGQPVKLFLDAFPYQRFGTRTATISWISPTTEERRIRAFAIPLDHRGFEIDGVIRPLRPGMAGQAHVITGSRTLAQYALEPLRQLKQNTR